MDLEVALYLQFSSCLTFYSPVLWRSYPSHIVCCSMITYFNISPTLLEHIWNCFRILISFLALSYDIRFTFVGLQCWISSLWGQSQAKGFCCTFCNSRWVKTTYLPWNWPYLSLCTLYNVWSGISFLTNVDELCSAQIFNLCFAATSSTQFLLLYFSFFTFFGCDGSSGRYKLISVAMSLARHTIQTILPN